MRLLLTYGTRPELIKLFPLQQELQCDTLFSGQHFSLIDEYSTLIPSPTHVLKSRSPNSLSKKAAIIIEGLEPILTSYDGVIVQGDTLTTYVTALTAFQLGKKIFYVEAGLRTHDLNAPFPEEGYRQMISRIATVNFAPTLGAAQNLRDENVSGDIVMSGNTIVDAVRIMDIHPTSSNTVLVTIHRRENIPHLEKIFTSINECAESYPHLEFLFPVHPNPLIRQKMHYLKSPNIVVSEPLPYGKFLKILAASKLIITDSGGLQEEAVCLGKCCIVCRTKTERPEGVETGHTILCNYDPAYVFDDALSRDLQWSKNPYGTGYASVKITNYLRGRYS